MKKEEKLLEEIGKIDEDLIPEVTVNGNEEESVSKDTGAIVDCTKMMGKKKRVNYRAIWLSVGAVAAAALLAIVILPKTLWENKGDSTITSGTPGVQTSDSGPVAGGQVDVVDEIYQAHLMASPVYPEIPPYPDLSDQEWNEAHRAWNEALSELRNQPHGYKDGYDEYCKKVLTTVFADVGENDNRVFSPLSLYMALAMTAEASDGATRQQILDVLCQPDIETSRAHTKSIWLANYMDDGLSELLLGNSLWMNSNRTYKQELLEILASEYFASCFCGDPSEDAYSDVFRKWINKQTGDLLKDFTDSVRLDPAMTLTLASTVYFSGQWSVEFDSYETAPAPFHATVGDETCDFMKNSLSCSYCNQGENFVAVTLDMKGNGEMRLLLPAEGMTPEELLQDEEALLFLNTADREVDMETFEDCVDVYVPKFDFSSTIELRSYLEKLGIANAFASGEADFSPLSPEAAGLCISSIVQDSRVMIDEKGCKAASVTIVELGMGGPLEPIGEVRFDRPFVFEIMSENGLPLFVGVVNNPKA
ncbi:MAG: hypothetical protein J5750_03380 [Clostridiales bacterium]|nr:hypothetical protein [Clostridiales bacterium]